MSGLEKFKEQLPKKENFSSLLTGKKIVIKSMNMFLRLAINLIWKNERLSGLVLKCDVLLLADVFEKFRSNSLKDYGLCPSHFWSTVASSCDAMLNMIKVELELIPGVDMYWFFWKQCSNYSKANNKYLKSYDPKQ